MTGIRKIERGQVYFLREDTSVGCELAIGRPAVVLSNQELIDELNTVVVALMTTSLKRKSSAVKVFTGKKNSYCLLDQLRTVDKSRLTEWMWDLPTKDVSRIDKALSYSLSVGEFLEESEEEHEEVVVKENNTEELASLTMELALHKALYEKTLEKLIELRLEKDGVTETVKPKAEIPKVVEEPAYISELQKKFDAYDAKKEMSDAEIRKLTTPANQKKSTAFKRAKLAKGAKTININTATREEFINIGVNDQTARNIVNYRAKHGLYISLEDLLMVPRFGKQCLEVFSPVMEV